MFLMTVKAKTMEELRDKLYEAAVSMDYKPLNTEALASPTIPTDTGVDAQGFPWDERIHASTKVKTVKGVWRTKRGVDETFLKAVQDATPRSQVFNGNVPVSAPTPDFVPAMPPAAMGLPPIPPTPPAPISNVIPMNPTLTYAAPAVLPVYDNVPTPPTHVQKPAHTFETFKKNLVPTCAALFASKDLTPEYCEQLKSYFKVNELWDIAKDDAKLGEMFNGFVQAGFVTRVD